VFSMLLNLPIIIDAPTPYRYSKIATKSPTGRIPVEL
jgi:hypothetical protein